MRTIAIAICSLLLVLGAVTSADIILLKNGGRLEGKVVFKDGDVIITMPNGTLTLPRQQIQQVIWGVTNSEVYQQLKALIAPGDAEGYYQLSQWCLEHKLPQSYQEMLQLALVANPDHDKTRKALGHELHEGRWLTKEEFMAIKGFVQYKGEWISKAERQELFFEQIQKQLDEERRLRQESEQRAVLLTQRLYDLELEVARLNGQIQRMSEEIAKQRNIIIHRPWPYPQNSTDIIIK